MDRPETTLFLLASVDGKISTGDTDQLDFDRDLKDVPGIKEGLHQYYDLEQQTDLVSLNTGRVMEKMGVNELTSPLHQPDLSFVIIDNRPHLNENGVRYLSQKLGRLLIATSHSSHPALKLKDELSNVTVINYLELPPLFQQLKEEHGIHKMTIQSGGTMNTTLLRLNLVDHISLVIAPTFVGGGETPTIGDGESLHIPSDLHKLRPLRLVKCDVLEESYLHLQYDVSHNDIRQAL